MRNRILMFTLMLVAFVLSACDGLRLQSPVVIASATPKAAPTETSKPEVLFPGNDSTKPTMTWQAADTPYGPPDMEWRAEFTCVGPAVCEWWDQQGDGFKHEGFVALKTGESVSFPRGNGYIGHVWGIPAGDKAVDNLVGSFRHLLFYKDKPQHGYMDKWLLDNGFGVCNFDDQSGCSALSSMVIHLPDGLTISK